MDSKSHLGSRSPGVQVSLESVTGACCASVRCSYLLWHLIYQQCAWTMSTMPLDCTALVNAALLSCCTTSFFWAHVLFTCNGHNGAPSMRALFRHTQKLEEKKQTKMPATVIIIGRSLCCAARVGLDCRHSNPSEPCK